MAQTTPGSTATTYEPPRAFWLTVIAAAVSWVLTVAGAIAEITDGFPRGLVGLAAVLAGSISVGAMYQRAEHASQRRHAELVNAAGALAAQVEQISAKGTRRDMVHLEAARRIAAKSTATGTLDRSEYYQVYTDVLMDLSGIRPDEDGGSPSVN